MRDKNKKRGLVSVIVPVYKVEEDLIECVKSIQKQTYKNLEIILIDDGSPDQCGEICNLLAQKDKRIKVIHQKNGGLSLARNAGMQIMTGEYVTFVDSDDVLEEEFVEYLIELMENVGAEVGICQNSVFTKKCGIIHRQNQRKIKEVTLTAQNAMKAMLYQKLFDVAAWGKIYRREIWKGIFFPEGLIHEDLSTTYKVILNCQTVVCTSKELYRYQIRKTSIEHERFTLKKMDCIKNAQMMLDNICTNYPEYASAARSRYVAAHFHILAQIEEEIPEKEVIINNIKCMRKEIVRDKEASIRVRGACFLSFFGFNFTVKLLNEINKHTCK